MLTHEEEKPHKCRVPDCNRTYCDARSLKRHIENAHQNILAAIHEGGHEEYRTFLPETAFVKTKELSSDFSIDSIESNSPRSSSIDHEQTFPIRSSNAQKSLPTYTYVFIRSSSIEYSFSSSLDLMKKNLLNVIFVKSRSKVEQH